MKIEIIIIVIINNYCNNCNNEQLLYYLKHSKSGPVKTACHLLLKPIVIGSFLPTFTTYLTSSYWRFYAYFEKMIIEKDPYKCRSHVLTHSNFIEKSYFPQPSGLK